jgi:hypothetical protein
MSHRLPLLLATATLLILGGCASSQPSTRQEALAQAQGGESPQHMCAMCPMNVKGVQVDAVDVDGGAALSFTTATGDVAALRAKVAQMAERHNSHHAMAGSPMGMAMMASKASVEELPTGARLVLKADAAAQVDGLRTHVHQRAEKMAKGECGCQGMSSGHGKHPHGC